MTSDQVDQAARSYGLLLDRACAAACESLLEEGRYSDFELGEGYRELWRLSQGKDLAYDRPSIGLHYALWYHLERTHEIVRALMPLMAGRDGVWSIYDIGCGTGATAWATAVVLQACQDSGVGAPRVRLYGWDTSPFMLEAAERLWSALPDQFRLHFSPSNRLGSWDERKSIDPGDSNKLVVCSFLLHSSDHLHMGQVDSGLSRFADRMGAQRLLLLSPWGKLSLANELQKEHWNRDRQFAPLRKEVWEGSPSQVTRVRRNLLLALGEQSKSPSWSPRARPVHQLLVRTPMRLFETSPDLWSELSKEQIDAAAPADRLTALVGSAGSGKSVVLVERLVRTVETARESPHLLVTSFNKRMVDKLREWTYERIGISDAARILVEKKEGPPWGDRHVTLEVTNSYGVTGTVWFLNRDLLPTRVWRKLPNNCNLFEQPTVRSEYVTKQYDDEFVKKEVELIVYGMEVMSYEDYIDPDKTPRRGRRTPLRREERTALWPRLVKTAEYQNSPFLYRRMAAWRHNRTAFDRGVPVSLQSSFRRLTHLFVDEAQDMTRADLRLLAHTPPRPQRLFITGDSAQALHTHGIVRRPRIRGAGWRELELTSSYRLPALICGALEGLARHVLNDQRIRGVGDSGRVPQVSRSSLPGPRPIIVNGANPSSVLDAMESMEPFVTRKDPSGYTWGIVDEAGSSSGLYDSLRANGRGLKVEPCSMLTYKGLELPLVLFPTDVGWPPGCGEAVAEWVYTSLTRARGVLIIVVCPEETPVLTIRALSLLDRDHLMFWDKDALQAWDAMIDEERAIRPKVSGVLPGRTLRHDAPDADTAPF